MSKGLYIATFDFESVEEGQLSIKEGDIIILIEKDDSGWWFGRQQKDHEQEGLFPFNYVEPYKPSAKKLTPPPRPNIGGSSGELSSTSASKKHLLLTNNSSQQLKSPGNSSVGNVLRQHNTSSPVSTQDVVVSMGKGAEKKFVARPPSARPPPLSGPHPPGKAQPAHRPGSPKTKAFETKSRAEGGKKKKDEPETVFRKYAHVQVAYGCSMLCFFLGIGGVVLGGHGLGLFSPAYEIAAGVIGAIYGLWLYYHETRNDGAPWGSQAPLRAMLWIASGCAFLASFALLTAGLSLIGAGITDIVGFYRGEQYKAPRKKKKVVEEKSMCEKFEEWLAKEVKKGRPFVFCCVYIGANIVAWVVTAIVWFEILGKMDEDKRLSTWAPFAKAFGAVIDINSSLILIPLCRTFLRMLYNVASSEESYIAYALRFVFSCIPLDKNHTMHRQLAKLTLLGVVGHTVVHFINYSIKPEQAVKRFGLWPFISGMTLLVIMVFIYAGGFEIVKRGTFEIFWYSHHLFILYFLLILVHGNGGWNPNFWKYLLIPGFFYLSERILRDCFRAKNSVKVMSVMTMEPRLISLEFDKKSAFYNGFKEGMYVFINAPSIRKYEWHPFTISSPPHKDTFTVHIQTQGANSWTLAVKEYMLSLGPKGAASFELTSRQQDGVMGPGRVLGPDGNQLFLIDGPHSAPTQHMTEYDHVLVAGAGIGLTPVAACVQSVVFHRWHFSVGKCYPSHAHFAWVVSHRDVRAYRWFVSLLKDVQDCVVNMRKKSAESMKTKTFKFHIYVTSAPKDLNEAKEFAGLESSEKSDPNFWGIPAPESKVIVEHANFSKMDLYKALLAPKKEQQLGDICIYRSAELKMKEKSEWW
eukprot:jgi/Bigna1/135715/aug1.30_g10423